MRYVRLSLHAAVDVSHNCCFLHCRQGPRSSRAQVPRGILVSPERMRLWKLNPTSFVLGTYLPYWRELRSTSDMLQPHHLGTL